MGLKNGVTVLGGIQLTDGYINIKEYTFYKSRGFLKFEMEAFKDKEARDAGKSPVSVESFALDYKVSGDDYNTYFSDSALQADGVSPEKQIYKYIKDKGLFANFSDVL